MTMGTGRLEAFSDGVMSVAITLLVLQIHVPEHLGGHTLAHALLDDWSHDVAYVVSFMTIGIIWINHHAMIGRLREADHSILMLNLVMLMAVAILPFATDLIATYLRRPTGHTTAAAVYAGSFLFMGVAGGALNRQILLRQPHLLRVELELDQRRRAFRAAAVGLVPYLVAFGLAFVSAYATLGVCAAVALYYALPVATLRALPKE